MAINNIIPFLIPLFIGVIATEMISNWEMVIATLCFGAAITFFVKASESNAPVFWLWGTIVFFVCFMGTAGDAIRRILLRNGLRDRIIKYIAEGEEIRANLAISTRGTMDYLKWTQDWSTKIAKDIATQKNQTEADLFLDNGGTQLLYSMIDDNSTGDSQKRAYIAQIAITRLGHLNDFLNRI